MTHAKRSRALHPMPFVRIELAVLAVASGWSAELAFSNRLISSDYTYGYGVGVADLDGDGDLDIVSSDCTTVGSRRHNDIY